MRTYLSLLITGTLLTFPGTAYASKNFGGGEVVLVLLVLPLLYIVCTFIAALANVFLKKVWLRVLSIFLTTPLLLLSLWIMYYQPIVGIGVLFVVIILGLIIFFSYEKRPAA